MTQIKEISNTEVKKERNSVRKVKEVTFEELSLRLKPHTVILTCGPSGVGKSHLLQIIKEKIDLFNEQRPDSLKLTYSILSSDQLRYSLLGVAPDTLDKFDSKMQQVSKQAFSLLENQLENLISYPINQHLVFVDTTGLHKPWREKIINMCKQKHYTVNLMLFNFTERKDFGKHSINKFVTEKGVKRLYEDVIPNLERHSYDQLIRINKHYTAAEISLENLIEAETYSTLARVQAKQQELKSADSCYIVGDLHGCLYTFRKLLESIYETAITDNTTKIKTTHLNKRVVLCGDVIDKGLFSKELLKLLLNNKPLISWVIGNHENFVHRYLSDTSFSSKGISPEVIKDYFTSIDQYKDDAEFKELLAQFVEESYPFLNTTDFIVTHAPCAEKYLGKVDRIAAKEQRNLLLLHADTKEAAEKLLEFLPKEAESNYPYHFFGHVATQKTFKVKNKISLDSAAVCGTGLTAFKIDNLSFRKPERVFVETDPKDLEGCTFSKAPSYYTLFDEDRVDYQSLEGKVKNRIDWLCKNKVNYISGTMSPSSQEIAEDNSVVDIESLKSGIEYYQKKGVKSIVLQPKYMGSRCNVYLSPMTSECYMTSRNGYIIKKLHKEKGSIENFRAFFKKIKDLPKVSKLFKTYPNIKYLILDGELLPWYALGKGLVEDIYRPLALTVNDELNALLNEGFYNAVEEKLNNLKEVLSSDGGLEAASKANYRLGKTLEAVAALNKDSNLIADKAKLLELKQAVKKFNYQVELFGKSGNFDFKPFAILKIVLDDGTEIVPDYVKSFHQVSDDSFIEIITTHASALKQAEGFFNSCVKQELEGVVLKPVLDDLKLIETKQIAPYLKVRNKEYLRLAYGYDYLENSEKYLRLTKKKDNRNKIKVSISEFNIGLKLLQTPFDSIAVSNQKYKELLASMIFEEEKEKGLDPRL